MTKFGTFIIHEIFVCFAFFRDGKMLKLNKSKIFVCVRVYGLARAYTEIEIVLKYLPT